MKKAIEFFVPGLPATSGSKRAFQNKYTKKIHIVPANPKKQRSWMSDVKLFASKAYQDTPLEGPIRLVLDFYLPRPKGHWGTGKNAGKLKIGAPKWPTKKPDLTKLIRATEDSLKGVIWKDDCQVVTQVSRKEYGEKIGVNVLITLEAE